MASGNNNLIIFGPTGAVGSVAAQTARHADGVQIYLAMRDVTKRIPGLSATEEHAGDYKRVYADLTNPASIGAAVQQARATRAFMYMVHGPTADPGLRDTITALKAAGIELVVFLSHFGIRDDPHAVDPSDLLPYAHAQVEINLQAIMGPTGYVAVRPTWFASNILNYKKRIQEGAVRIPYAQLKFDWITPTDVGAVIGAILARPKPHDGPSVVNLVGPEQLSNEEATKMIAHSLGKDVHIVDVGYDEGKKVFMDDHGLPDFIAAYLMGGLLSAYEGDGGILNDPLYKKSVDNIQLQLGRPPTRLQAWIDQNREAFTS